MLSKETLRIRLAKKLHTKVLYTIHVMYIQTTMSLHFGVWLGNEKIIIWESI